MAREDASATSGGSLDQYPIASSSKQPRLYFPADGSGTSGLSQRANDLGQRAGPSISRSYSTRRNFTSVPRTPPSKARRRVKSVGNGVDGSFDPHRGSIGNFITPPRTSHSFANRVLESVQQDESGQGLVSDEYDLSHEDPRILQDVQKALKLKARREARLGGRSTAIRIEPAASTHVSSNTLFEEVPKTLPLSQTRQTNTSDIDFGPSTASEPSNSGPVPSSLDNGKTLDWSGEEERTDALWRLTSIARRKGKETYSPIKSILESQESSHADKIARIKQAASPNTLRKVEIITEQLGRRYQLVYDSISEGTLLNIAQIARWHGSQEQTLRETLEKAEPFTWLRHLEKRAAPSERSPRNLTALIMEEYFHAMAEYDLMTPIPEDSVLPNPSPEKPGSSSPLRPVLSRNSTNRLYPPHFDRKTSYDDGVSFEPFIESARNSLESRRSGESSFSSLPIGASATAPPSRHASITRSPGPKTMNKEEAASASEQSDAPKATEFIKRGSNMRLSPIANSEDGEGTVSPGITIQLTAASPGPASGMHSQSSLPTSPKLSPVIDRAIGRRRIRARSRSPELRPLASERPVKRNVSSDKSYAQKSRLLEETSQHNHKMRQLLNRISGAVRDYETTQSSAMASLHVKHKGLPKELLDAFGHDPAAVTGNTRRFRGWRAVDDIHQRLLRQRTVFQDFIERTSAEISIPKSVLDDPIELLVKSLDALEEHSQRVGQRAQEVAEKLSAVQEVHSSTKENYKRTLMHTSVVYPELSHIVALEENYKDQYQQFWEFGMDTLTFFLDTLTPVWRTYGTTIGKDIQDFLIIPLYRNEFTGEAKRYPIYRLPTRSPRHWAGLFSFAVLSVAINILQFRAAVSSSVNYRLKFIPYDGIRWTAFPFFWVGILVQWLAVITELAIVLMQVVVVIWWLGWTIRVVH